jgi:hypothetical protein
MVLQSGVPRRRESPRPGTKKLIGILDLLADTANRSWPERLYAAYFRRQFMSIMPQVVAVWCRQLGHDVSYATYYGQADPRSLLPESLDVLFVSAYTQASALAYALARRLRQEGTLTVLGGPHARSFPVDALRFFDIVVGECDKGVVEDILRGRVDRPAYVTSGRSLTDIPCVEERMPEISGAAFVRGRPIFTSIIPLLASVGCPYSCNFCVDWNSKYVAFSTDRLEADLRYVSNNWPDVLVGFHDPNFGVRFDETMDVMERIPEGRRSSYIMESSLSILKETRLPRLKSTRCVYCAPGVESWSDYSGKAGVGTIVGRQKLEQVAGHFERLGNYVGGLSANFLFGADVDRGEQPVELTKEFVRRLPRVWPNVNIPTPFGGTPLHEAYVAERRILTTMPFAFYYNPYLAITIKHYDPVRYYEHLIDIYEALASTSILRRRLLTRSPPAIRIIHSLRTFAARRELAEFRRIRNLLATDGRFRAFHEGISKEVPDYYHQRLDRRLGGYAELFPRADRVPILDGPPDASMRTAARSRRALHEMARGPLPGRPSHGLVQKAGANRGEPPHSHSIVPGGFDVTS